MMLLEEDHDPQGPCQSAHVKNQQHSFVLPFVLSRDEEKKLSNNVKTCAWNYLEKKALTCNTCLKQLALYNTKWEQVRHHCGPIV